MGGGEGGGEVVRWDVGGGEGGSGVGVVGCLGRVGWKYV